MKILVMPQFFHWTLSTLRNEYDALDEMQRDLDAYLVTYNTKRPHQGRGMNGRTPYQAFIDDTKKARAKRAPKNSKLAA